MRQRVGAGRAECEAGGAVFGQRLRVGIDDGVDQSAHTAHDRNRCVAKAIELGQAAGLEARRQHDRVGAGDDLVRVGLVVDQPHRDLPAKAQRSGGECLFQIGVAASLQHQLRALGEQFRQDGQHQIEAFLRAQPADDCEQRRLRVHLQP